MRPLHFSRQNKSSNSTKDTPFIVYWYAGATFLCLWAILLFVSMNWQIKVGVKIAGYLKPIAGIVLVVLLLTIPGRLRLPLFLKLLALATLASGWLWGINDTFYWDGIQTAGRGFLFLDGRSIARFSLSYIFLGKGLRCVGNFNWVGHLYVMLLGAAALYLLSRTFQNPAQRWLVVVMAFLTPHVFVLSKWLYLDIPVIACIVMTVIAFDWAARSGSVWRFGVAAGFLTITSLMKEIGFVAAIPVILLPLFVPRGRRLKTFLISLISVCIAFGILIFLWHFYRQHQSGGGHHVKWLLLNPEKGSPSITVSWFFWAVREHLRTLLWWGFLVFALLGLVRPRKKGGYVVVGLILLAQLLALYTARYFHVSGIWHPCPLNEPSGNTISHWMLLAIALLLGTGLISGALSWRRPRRIERMSWILVISIIFIFSATGKTWWSKPRHRIWMGLDWRYLGPSLPFLAILAANGVGRLLVRRHPIWLRTMAALTLAVSLLFVTLRSTTLSAYFCEKARLNGEAYEAIRKRPEKVVFTHWPFFMGAEWNYDYGQLRWKSDGIKLRSIYELYKLRVMPANKRPRLNAIVLQSNDICKKLQSWGRFPDIVFDKTVKIYYLRPFDPRLKGKEIYRNYAAKVKFGDLKR